MAAAAAGAASQSSPQLARAMAEQAAQVPLRLALNSLSLLLILEGYLRTKTDFSLELKGQSQLSKVNSDSELSQSPAPKSPMDGISLEVLKLYF